MKVWVHRWVFNLYCSLFSLEFSSPRARVILHSVNTTIPSLQRSPTNSGKKILWGMNSPACWCAGFPNKVTIAFLKISSLCPMTSNVRLNSEHIHETSAEVLLFLVFFFYTKVFIFLGSLATHWLLFFSFIFISWRLITLQYCSGFCHTLTWVSHGFTCVPHPDTPSCLPPHPIPLGLPRAPTLGTCLMHPTWAGGLFQPW